MLEISINNIRIVKDSNHLKAFKISFSTYFRSERYNCCKEKTNIFAKKVNLENPKESIGKHNKILGMCKANI